MGGRVESVLDAAERAAAGIREDAQEWARRYLDEARHKADQVASERVNEISALTDNLLARARAVAQQSDELIAALDDAGRRVLNNARPGVPPPPPTGAAPQPPPADGFAPQEVPPGRPPAEPAAAPAPPPREIPVPPAAAPPFDAPPAQAPAPQTSPPAPAPHSPPPQAPPPQPPPQVPPPERLPPQPSPPPQQAPQAPAASGVSEGARLLATQMAVAGSTRDEITWRLREEFGIQDASAILDEIGI